MEVDDLSPAVTGSAIPTVPSAVAKKKASTQVWPLTFWTLVVNNSVNFISVEQMTFKKLKQACFFIVRLTTGVNFFCLNFEFSCKSLEFSREFIEFSEIILVIFGKENLGKS